MRTGRAVHLLVVRVLTTRARRGVLEVGAVRLPCALGRSGIVRRKREGDGGTPAGRWPLRTAHVRADRSAGPVHRPGRRLAVRPLRPDDGWCDAVGDRNYNRAIRHPYPASAERMWRADGLYDIVVVMGYNDGPRCRGRGSAIFLHCARETGDGLAPTEGCIALRRRDLARLLPHLTRCTVVAVG
jgi:L,D-peptidoglycan transpeptidase YkuD (ErfK/YbiS/YcfS/YnhG family)